MGGGEGRRGRGGLKCTLGTPASPGAFLHTGAEVGQAADVCSEWGWVLWGHGPHLFIGFVLHLGVSGQEIQREQQLLRYLEQDHCIDWNNEIQHEHQLMCRLEQRDTARTTSAASSGTRKYSTNSNCCIVWNKEIQHEQQLLHRLEQGNTARTTSAVSSGTRRAYSMHSNRCVV